MLLAAILVRMDSPGPVIFKQQRVGKNGKIFHVFKFRTMVEDSESMGPLITAKNDPRITQIGVLLRWIKIDELPQLFNVLSGDMSLVGPRPEVPKMVDTYSEEEKAILSVKPGIFGPNQIANRDEAAKLTEKGDVEQFYIEHILPDKKKEDLAYVRNKNLFKDIKILFQSLAVLSLSSVKVRYILESRRRLLFLLVDIGLSIFCYWMAFMLRFEGKIPPEDIVVMKTILPFVILLRVPCFVYFGLYQTLWQYLGIQELIFIIKAVTVGSLLLPIVPFLMQIASAPRSILIIEWFLLIMILGGSRVFFKVTAERLKRPQLGKNRKNVLIVGADDTGELLVREFIKRPSLGYRPIGFVDDDLQKLGIRIHGVKVIGRLSQLSQVVNVKKADEVIIALSGASGNKIREITEQCRELRLPCVSPVFEDHHQRIQLACTPKRAV